MRKELEQIRKKQNACDVGICFEALEPRLLLSGNWGAGADGPSPESQSNSPSAFGPETVTLSEGPDTFGSDALLQNQHSPGVGTFVDVLANATVLNAFDASGLVPEAPSPLNQTPSATGDTPANGTESSPELELNMMDTAEMHELVFVNDNVADYERLITDLKRGDDDRTMEVVILDSTRDGIAQVSETLADRSDMAAVHFITHGTDGQINLGDSWLNGITLLQNSDAVADWGNALAENGDILFYGCNVAADSDGQGLLDDIAKLTGAEVAASDDLTGHDSQGGDWDLEYTRGKVETNLAVGSSTQPAWSGVLSTFTVSNTNDSGDGSLRKAIMDANANIGVTDTINFSIGSGPQTIAVGSAGLPIITDSVILDATTQPGYSGTPLITLDGSATPASSGINGINLRANNCTVKGFIVINFADEGIEMDGSTGFGDNNIIQNNWVGIDADGNVAGNAEHGIMISANANGNQIGGTGPNEGNVTAFNGFSGIIINENSDNNIVEGNIIGLKPDGTTPAGNGTHGILIQLSSDSNRIGGTTAGAGNIIAGNTQDGIYIDGTTDATYTTVSSGTMIKGNWIGTTGTGSAGVGNGNTGINVEGTNTIIGGIGANDGNVITNNGNEGINVAGSGATGTIIQGNIIGLDPDGSTESGNTDVGIALLSGADDTTIGGTTVSARNIISYNKEGIEIRSNNNVIQGNYIGTDAGGTLDRGNRSDDGVEIQSGSSGNLIGGEVAGAGNIIAFNALNGVTVVSGSNNAIVRNAIHSNTLLGINLGTAGVTANDLPVNMDSDTGANNLQNFPVLTSAVITGSQITITGTLNSTASTNFRIEFYANATGDGSGYGEGQALIGVHDVSTDGFGNATIAAVLPAALSAGNAISATASRLDAGDAPIETSEFSQNVIATAANALWISADQDSIPPAVGAGADGLPGGWKEGEVLQFGGPDLTLGPATDGDFSSVIDFDTFTTDASDPGALHFVSRALTIGSGANQFNLQIGDVLVSFNQDETIRAAYYETGADTTVHMNDLLAFRPDVPGDYTSGTFYMLLNGVPYPGGGAISNLNAISLVEQDTYVGNTLLESGSFLFSEQSGSGSNTPNNIYHFTPTDAGQAAAAGTSQILIDGDDIGIEALTTSHIRGLDLIEKPTTIGGLTFDSGDILVTLNIDDASVGDAPSLNTSTSDIFVLKVTQSEPESGNTTVATAEMVLDGSLVNFDGTERVYAISVVPDNFGPAVGGDATGSVTEDVGVVAGNISDSGALTIADPDAGESFFVAETIAGTYGSLTIDAAGAWTYTADNSQAAIQGLDDGENLSDELMVTTVDGTTQRITITINGAEDAPTVANPIADQNATEDAVFSFQFAANTFADVDATDTLTYTATLDDDSALPVWLGFDAGTRTFSGTPTNADVGTISVKVTADDGTSTVFESFDITVANINDAPVARPDGVHLSFDGDDFIQVADDPSLQMTNNVTMEAWINHSGSGTGTQIILNKEGEYEMAITADTGEIKYAIAGTGPTWNWHNTGHFVTPGEWTHVAVTYDAVAGEVKTYINGTLVETFTQSDPIGDVYPGWNELRIGDRENATDQRFQGLIDEVRVWNTTRTQAEIQAAMNGLLTGIESGLVGNWRFDEGSGGVVVDQSASGNDGILGGSPATPSYQGYYTNEDTPLTVPAASGVLANDVDADGDPLTVTNIDTTGMLGTLALDPADGSFTYDPRGVFDSLDAGEHVIETFTYTANDGFGNSNTATVTITVIGVNDTPTTTGIADVTVDEDALNTVIDLFAAFADAEDADATLIYTIETNTTPSLFSATTIDGVAGTLTLDYATDQNGTADITVRATDTGGLWVESTFTVTVNPVNDAPTTTGLADVTVDEDAADTLVDLFAAFADVEDLDPALSYTIETNTNPALFTSTPIDGVAGTLTLDYAAAQSGTADITVRATDSGGLWGESTFTVTVNPVDNDDPVVVNNTGSTAVEGVSDTLLAAELLYTDSEQPATSVTYTVTGGLANGQLELTTGPGVAVTSFTQDDIDNNRLVYVHDGSNTISDTVDFSVDDGQGNTLAGQSFNITVTAVDDDAPVLLRNTGSTVNEGGTDTISNAELRYFDTEQPVASLTYMVTIGPNNGQLELTTNPGNAITSFTQSQINAGRVVYVHDGSNSTTDSFTFSVDDGQGNAVTGQTFNLTIIAINDVPVATANTVTTTEDNAYNFTASDFTFSDIEGDSLVSATITNFSLAGGALTHNNGIVVSSGDTLTAAQLDTLVYTSAANANGSPLATFDFTVNDAGAGVVSAQMGINVTAVNDAPVGSVTIDNMTPAEGDTLTASNTLADADGLGGPINYQWYLDGIAIGSATGNIYTTVPADVGGVITVVASYTDDQGTFESVTSAATAAVTNVNEAPVISGGNTGAVTKDVDPDTDGLLEVGGGLTISDPDAGESRFQTGTVVGSYGSLTIDATGIWNYAADNTQAAIQQLDEGENLTDVLTVTTADGTTHNVTITINGAEDSSLVDDSPGPVDEGGTDPDPGDDVDPIEPEPDELPPTDDELLPPKKIGPQNLHPSDGHRVMQSHWTPPRHFVPTFALRTPENAYRNANVSPSITARYLSTIKQEPTSGSHESRIEGNFVSAATVFFSPETMAQALDHLQSQIDDTLELEANQGQLIIGAAAGFGTTVMVGYVVWAFRGASLLLSALSAMPMWRCFDPLPVLIGDDKKREEDNEEKSGDSKSEDDEKSVRDLLDSE